MLFVCFYIRVVKQKILKTGDPVYYLTPIIKSQLNSLHRDLKKVLPKIIHPDQKKIVDGRNITDGYILIQDIMDYIDKGEED